MPERTVSVGNDPVLLTTSDVVNGVSIANLGSFDIEVTRGTDVTYGVWFPIGPHQAGPINLSFIWPGGTGARLWARVRRPNTPEVIVPVAVSWT